MTKKQTQCPECATIYKVSVEQLTMAQGMVCCPKCFNNFNALLNLVVVAPQNLNLHAIQVDQPLLHHDYEYHVSDHILARSYQQKNVLDIFDRQVEDSNLNLYGYLNNLNYLSSEQPIHQFPSLKLSEQDQKPKTKRSLSYTLFWGSINLFLLLLLIVQILWLNPALVSPYPVLAQSFETACEWINCSNLDDRYQQVKIYDVSLTSQAKHITELSGVLINRDSKSILLPHIVVHTKQADHVTHYVLEPHQYLEKDYQGIERLPSKTPFRFRFQLPIAKNEAQITHLDVIKP